MQPVSEVLSAREIDVVRQGLRACVDGPFFPEWEFQTLLGVDRETVRTVYNAWPDQTIDAQEFGSAIVGCLNNLLGYPHGQDWDKHFSVKPEEMKLVLDHLIEIGM
jgi:hypothetical protein